MPFTLIAAEPEKPDKSRYWLGNPTPKELLRPLTTEAGAFNPLSAYTVDAGHVQLENGFIYARELNAFGDKSETETRQWTPALRIGILNWLETKVSADLVKHRVKDYAWIYEDGEDIRHYGPDWRYTTFALKANVIGNDGGRFAAAIQPFYSHASAHILYSRFYGVSVPFTLKLTEATRLNWMSTVRFDYPFEGMTSFSQTVQLRHSFFSKLDLYGQFQATFWDGTIYDDWWGRAGAGIAFRPIKNLEMQLGSDFRVTEAHPFFSPEDVVASASISFRY